MIKRWVRSQRAKAGAGLWTDRLFKPGARHRRASAGPEVQPYQPWHPTSPSFDHTRGWRREDIRLEVTAAQIDIVYGKGQRRPAGRLDYLLCRPPVEGMEAVPLAIMEAKH